MIKNQQSVFLFVQNIFFCNRDVDLAKVCLNIIALILDHLWNRRVYAIFQRVILDLDLADEQFDLKICK